MRMITFIGWLPLHNFFLMRSKKKQKTLVDNKVISINQSINQINQSNKIKKPPGQIFLCLKWFNTMLFRSYRSRIIPQDSFIF